MIGKKMSNTELVQKARFSANIMTKLKKDESVLTMVKEVDSKGGGTIMVSAINKYVSRYVVSFYYDYEDNGYSKMVDKFRSEDEKDYKLFGLPKDCKWIETGFWENYRNDDNTQPEMDIYTYLLEVMKEDLESLSEANLGTSFVMKTNGSIFNLQYVPNKNKAGLSFKCTDLGILIFRNGIGFIWYDIEFGRNPSIDEYVDFQHDFKELARTHSEKFRKKTGRDTYDVFCMGKWLAQILDTDTLGIKFWTERKSEIDEKSGVVCIPDKALLFQYLFIGEAEKQERMNLAFRIANGYDTKYNSPSNLEGEIYEPFGNTCFYTSKTGTAYIVSNNESNATFFEDNFKGKYIRDYFFIYVLLLYQTYSSAHYSRLLTKLPADVKSIESNSKYIKLLELLDSQINLFLVKSVYESVSNIQHQNGAYIYGKKALRIEEDMKSLTVGLEALRRIEVERQKKINEDNRIQLEKREQVAREELERKEKAEQELIDKKDRALNKGLVIFGFLVVISAAIDALNLVDWFRDHTMEVGHWISLGVIAVLTIFMFIVLIFSTNKKK